VKPAARRAALVAVFFAIAAATIHAPASSVSALLIGVQQTAIPFPGLCTSIYVNPVLTVNGATDATGTWSPALAVPFNAAFVGVPLIMQSAVSDASRPFPLTASNGLKYRAAPAEPAFAIGLALGATGTSMAANAGPGRAVVVKFN